MQHGYAQSSGHAQAKVHSDRKMAVQAAIAKVMKENNVP
jgi:hypothetical protein